MIRGIDTFPVVRNCLAKPVAGPRLVHQMMMIDANLVEAVGNAAGREVVGRLVDRLLADLGMTELGQLEFFEAVDLSAPGWSFIQPITTSHVSGHYFELPGDPPRIHVDVYSCRRFDPQKTIAVLHRELCFGRWVGTLVVRDMDLMRRDTMELEGCGDRLLDATPLRPAKGGFAGKFLQLPDGPSVELR